MITRDEIRHLCLEHDRFMAEARETLRTSRVSESDMMHAEPIGRPLVQKSGEGHGLLFKTVEDASVRAPQPAANASDNNETLRLLDLFSAATVEKIRQLDRQNLRLQAQLDVVLTLLAGDKSKSGEPIDVPNWRRRDVA